MTNSVHVITAAKVGDNWYVVKCEGVVFFGRSEVGALLRAYVHFFRTDEGFDDFYRDYRRRKAAIAMPFPKAYRNVKYQGAGK